MKPYTRLDKILRVNRMKYEIECRYKGKFVVGLYECFPCDKSMRKELTFVVDCLHCSEFVSLKRV